MDSLDIAINFPHNLLVVCLGDAFPLLGQSLRETQSVLTAREISIHFKQLIDETLIPTVTFFQCDFSFRCICLINKQVIPLFTGLKKVVLGLYGTITDEGLQKLTSIEELDLSHNLQITDKSVQKLVNLRSLNLFHCDRISGECLRYLTQLKTLGLKKNVHILGACLLPLSRLEELDLSDNATVNDSHLVNMLHSLRVLKLNENYQITDTCVAQMTRLERLSYGSRKIDDAVLMQLTNLKKLSLFDHHRNTDRGLSTLTGLTSINLGYNSVITTAGLTPFLHCLKHIYLRDNTTIDRSILFLCPNLESVIVDDPDCLSSTEKALQEKGVRFVWRERDLQ
jgi:Leucine-rich repeat (LRR) protein